MSGAPRASAAVVVGPALVRRHARRRTAAVAAITAATTVVVLVVSLSVGDFPVPLRDVARAVLGAGPDDARFVVRTLRLPRALLAVLAGAAFGAAGAVFQGVTRNPLASPDILGITAGAASAAVFCIVVLGATASVVSLAALVGAVGAALGILALTGRGSSSALRLVLLGIGLNAWLMSITGYLLTRANVLDAQRATVWLTGSLAGGDWRDVRTMSVACAVLLPLLVAHEPVLGVLQLGEDTARALGLAVGRGRALVLLLAVALAATATASAGPISFVALVSPTVARRLTRAPIALVPSALIGALLVALADFIARSAFAPVELPVGVVTGVIGAPYLVWLLTRAGRVRSAT